MIDINSQNLLECLRQNQYEAELQEETEQVYTLLKINQQEYPLFIRIFDDGHLLQVLAFFPCPLNQDKIPDLARLLHLLNKELDMPGFGMDEMAGAIFYRLMLPTPMKKIEQDMLIAFVKTVEHVCKMFAPAIQALAMGQITLEDILSKAREVGQNK